MSSTDRLSGSGGPFVTRDVCQAVHAEQRRANERTWEEIRSLRRLVIALVVGGQLFTGGLNVGAVGYWLEQHAAQPHASTLQMLADVRAETRQDLRDLRRELEDLARAVRTNPANAAAGRCPASSKPDGASER